MNVIFTCGGTGGHINPAIAVAKMLQARRPNSNILFIGAEDGMENKLVPREGFRLETVRISNFQRSLWPKGIWHNLKAAGAIIGALRQAGRLIDEFQPDVILGTGGYASFPALYAGAKRHIPTAVHESNAIPGLTTRMVANKVERILVSFEDSIQQYDNPGRVIVTGMPVREEFIFTKQAQAKLELGLDRRPLIVSYWGSLGAREMNKIIADFMVLESQEALFQHVHATGSYGWKWMPDYVKQHGLQLQEHPEIDMREYLFDMPKWMAAADLVICRAGASTINEVAASGTPCIIVPSPNAAEDHQSKNAEILAKRGAAAVIKESECSGKVLYETAKQILQDPDRCQQMASAIRKMAVVDSTERIYSTILELAKER